MHRLALALGKTVHEIETTMTAKEFRDWADYYALDPFGDTRADIRSGVIAATIANVHRGKGRKAYSPADFMPFLDKPDTSADVAKRFAAEFSKATKHLPINIISKGKKRGLNRNTRQPSRPTST